MSTKNIWQRVKKNWGSIILYALIALLIFSPDAKSWMLRQVVNTGLLKPEIQTDKKGEQSPATRGFQFTDAQGLITDSKSLQGKVVFINFWASWCPPCRAEMPDLQRLYGKLKTDDRFVFIFINEDEDKSKAAAYLAKNNFTMPLHYRSGNIPEEIFSGTLPTTVVLNKNGEVVLKQTGMATYDSEDFINQLKALL